MKRQLSVTSRQELMDSLRARYRSGSRVEKCRILDEFVAVTGYHRKHSIRLLTLGRVARPAVARARPRRYGNAVAEAQRHVVGAAVDPHGAACAAGPGLLQEEGPALLQPIAQGQRPERFEQLRHRSSPPKRVM